MHILWSLLVTPQSSHTCYGQGKLPSHHFLQRLTSLRTLFSSPSPPVLPPGRLPSLSQGNCEEELTEPLRAQNTTTRKTAPW